MSQENSFQLRPFQKDVLKYVLNGQSVILQAPTGAGKTRAALQPFLQNLAHQRNDLPLTCRYAVPMRVLANQFYREYETTITGIDHLAPTCLSEKYRQIGCEPVSIQTGEQPSDPQFESALTFCTIDQLLASFLAVPYGVGAGRANLNVAGVTGSYLVLDEFHLYPLLRDGKSVFGARTTTIQMLRLLKSITPFVLMTATFSSSLLSRLAELLGAKVVTVKDSAELQDIAQGRTRTFQCSQEPMHAQSILAEHQQRTHNKCTLVVCNSVLRAQKMFLDLKHAESQGTRVVLLHSRFTIEDRRRLAAEIEHELGPDQWKEGIYQGRNIIVVATQVIEVGLNISAEVLHTENAPANSLVQRAGRCARFANQQGHVIVYPLPFDEDGKKVKALPYDQPLCDATWNALAQFDGRQVGFPEEQKLIDDVHTEEDQDLLRRYELNKNEILTPIFESFNCNDRSVSSQLIRDVAQVQVLIHDHPGEEITEAPWRWQSFSMHPYSLASAKRWAILQDRGKDLEWICKEAIPIVETQLTPDGADGFDNRQKTIYQWKPITNNAEVAKALIIALPRQLARYDSELGFVLLDGRLGVKAGEYQSTLLPALVPQYENNGSRQTSYQDHIAGLARAYKTGIQEDMHYIVQRLEREMALSRGIVDQAIRLAIACHDLGKLDQQWQQWALAWQTLLYQEQKRPAYQLPNLTFCFAKTNYDYSPWQRKLQSKVYPKRPHHACESVAIARKLIGQSLGISKTSKVNIPVLRAVCGAIARHHTSQASEYGPVNLSSHAMKAATEAFQKVHQGLPWTYDISILETRISQGDDLAPETASIPKITRPELESGRPGELETWLYFVIVRALRLADQRADGL